MMEGVFGAEVMCGVGEGGKGVDVYEVEVMCGVGGWRVMWVIGFYEVLEGCVKCVVMQDWVVVCKIL